MHRIRFAQWLAVIFTPLFLATPAMCDCMEDGTAAWRKGDIDKAIEHFTDCCNAFFIYEPKKGTAYAYRGYLYHTKGRNDLAFKDFEMAFKLQPRRDVTLDYRGLVYLNTKQYDKAIEDFTELIDLAPKYADAYNKRGISYQKKGEIEKARLDFMKALELEPGSERYRRNLASLPEKKALAPAPAPAQTQKKIVDTTPPEIVLHRAIGVTQRARHEIRGQASDASGVAIVEIAGKEVSLDGNGNFVGTVLLAPGKNEIIITATDRYENVATKTIIIERPPDAAPAVQSAAEEPFKPGSYYALLVAVEQYAHPSINDLSQPVADARRLKNELERRYTFDSGRVKLLENPTRAEIMDAFERLSQHITPNDNLLIFYAGHGYWDDRFGQGYWLPSDAEKGSKAAWLSNSTIRDYIRGMGTRHTLLISDACFAGGIFKTRSAFSDAPQAAKALYELPSRKAMTSGTLTEVPDKSVFIEYLIKRLADNQEKYLSSERLFSRFREAVINNSPTRQVPQFGEIRESGDEGGDFIFVKK